MVLVSTECYSTFMILQAHSSVERAALLGAVTIRKIQSDENYSMQSGSLEEAIKKDIKDGLIPFFVRALKLK